MAPKREYPDETRVCPVCGEKFVTRANINKVYCSVACSNKMKRSRKSKNTEKRTCLHCGKEFIPKTKNQKFCCADCSHKHDSYVVRVCAHCGKEFEAISRSRRSWCSTTCLDEMKKKNKLTTGFFLQHKIVKDEADQHFSGGLVTYKMSPEQVNERYGKANLFNTESNYETYFDKTDADYNTVDFSHDEIQEFFADGYVGG